MLVNEKMSQLESKALKEEGDEDEDEEELDDIQDVMFKVKIDKAEPEEVKISKKNVCIVTVLQGQEEDKEAEEHEKLLNYFMATREASWSMQFKNAVMLGPQIDEDNLIVDEVSAFEAFMHFATIFWKLLFAFVPPAQMGGGLPAFVVALSFIGIITAIVGEVATILGCTIGLSNSVTAITLVALGTSLPDTFASMTAAKTSKHADSAVGNITGSNSVNVFLGLGLPWVIASHYNSSINQVYQVPQGPLGYSVFLFLMCSLACFVVLIFRRCVSSTVCANSFIGDWRRAGRPENVEVYNSSHDDLPLVHVHHFLNHRGRGRLQRMNTNRSRLQQANHQ